MKNSLLDKLKDGDLRSVGNVDKVLKEVTGQAQFDELFQGLSHHDRKIKMRAADAVEKLTVSNPGYLLKHKTEILQLCNAAHNIEFKWHLALLIPRLPLREEEIAFAWTLLNAWANDQKESKIVRVNSLQALFQLTKLNPRLRGDFRKLITNLDKEGVPSISARVRKIKKDL